jgi:uncharacterized membrane protein YsdA (DUF1294 family)/cold shock CspA family protein
MRHQGKITKWKDDQGFGFITPRGGGNQVFVHIKAFSNRHRRPIGNEIVTYETVFDDKGRIRAGNVEFMGDSSKIHTQNGPLSFAIPFLFLMFLSACVLLGQLSFVVVIAYLVASAISFLVYAKDKSAAERNQWRTSERTLHILGLLGGWPGAFIAQKLLRHKSTKESFQKAFWATVVLNCVGLVWLFSLSAVDALKSVLNAAGVTEK